MHFTYQAQLDDQNLHQGDVLKRTDGLDEILAQVHPHYHVQADYSFFSVLTQTCDLARRGGPKCSSRYVTICAVRPFELVLERFVDSLLHDPLERSFSFSDESRRVKLEHFVARLLNNNEDPYFYLHREPGAGLGRDHCAFLRLSIALKADLHYDTLLQAKILQLTEAFEHKLGFLVGNVYGRVGTRDWVPDDMTEEEFGKEVRRRSNANKSVHWLERQVYAQLIKRLRADDPDGSDLPGFVEALRETKKGRGARIEEMIALIKGKASGLVADDDIPKLVARLQNDPEFRAYVK